MGLRYNGTKIIINDNELYENLLEERGLTKIRQYTTHTLPYPTAQQISRMALAQHVWGIGDRFYKLAHHYYGDATLWWVIAWFNQTPTEAHLNQGDVVHICLDLQELMNVLGL